MQFRCRAGRENRDYYTDDSNELSLTVTESPKPTVTINPDTQVFIRETVTFRCDIEEGGDTEWTYNWFWDSNTFYTSLTKEFSIRSVTVSHRGQYACRGRRTSDSQMSKKSDPVTLSVSEKPKPQLTSNIEGDVLRGNTVYLSCTLTPQSAGWKFYWSKYTQSHWTETKTGTPTSDSYTFSSDKVYDRSQYRCRAGRENRVFYTDYSNVLSLNVIESPKPTVTIKPDTQVFIGETVTFRCDVEEGGDTEWTYDLFRDSNTLYQYSTKKEFSIRSVTVSHRGQYTCRGRRTSDSQMSEKSDSVTLSVSGKPKPTLTVTPQSSVYTGDTVTLRCNLVSTGWTFLWYEDQIGNSRHIGETNTKTHTVTVSNEGQVSYDCYARRRNYYSERSEPATITVRARPKPEVKVQPDDHGFVFTGETVTFSCEIKTRGSWKYQWFRDNNELSDAKGKKIYKINYVKVSHKGVYTCKGTQSSNPRYTETSDAVTLTVSEKPKPQLTSSPKGDVLRGNSVTLYCTLTPQSAGWKFHWYKYTQSSETETTTGSNTISLDNVYDRIKYKCRAGRENPVYYTDYSNELSLNVIESPKPTVTINPDTQVFIGETVTFRCDVQKGRDTEWTYDWFRDSNTFYPYSTKKEFSISSVTVSHRGQYTCRGTRTSDSQMSKKSDSVTLSVSGKPKPTVIVTPQSSVYTGDNVTLSCNLVSTGWTFLWHEGQKQNPLSSRGSDTKTHTVTVSNEGQVNYYCKAHRGNYNTAMSETATITVRARPKPEVKVQPDDHGTVFTGETVTFSCEIMTVGSWVYQWFRDNNELRDAKGKKIYRIIDVKESHKGVYTCKGTQSSDPQYTETSDAVTLTVSEKPKPQLTSSFKGAVLRGNSVTLYCTLTPQSAGWKFYWSNYTQSHWTETETTSDTYNISSDNVYDKMQYRCRGGRGNPVYYTDYSNELSLTVIESPKPTVTINPDTQVFIDETVTFRCDVGEGRDTEWTYEWFRDSNTYPYSTIKEFSTSYVTVSHRGQYTCRGRRISDSQMSEMSDSVTLSVSGKPKPTVIVTPQSSVYTGDTVTLSCNLMSTGWTFLWYKDQKRNPLSTKDSDTKTHTVRVSNKEQVNYYCKARRGNYYYYSEMSEPATITVRARPKSEVKVQPADHGFVFTGETVTFSCEIKTGGSWEYHWFRDNNELRDVKGKKIYKITDVKESHKGVYTCKGTQSSDPQYTETSDAVTLTVSEKPKPQLTSSPKGDVLRGNSVTLSCTLTPQSAGWKFYWSKYTQSHWTETETTSGSYTISSDNVYDRIQYKCRAGRENRVFYTDYSNELWVNVIESPKPTVTINPDTQVFIGETVTFKCDVQKGRDTEWTYDWFRDSNTFYPYSTKKEFSISDVTVSHGGQYTCRGRRTSDSQMSEMSDPVTLSVSGNPKPTVIVTPQSSVYTGDTVTLSCNLMSTVWTFFWYKGQTSNFLHLGATNTNTHTVRVSNKRQVNYYCNAHRGNFNTEMSEPATITVRARPKPEVKVQPADHGIVFTGETVTFSCEIMTGGSWVYQWFRDNNELSDAKGKKIYIISDVKESHKGVYTCKGTQTSDPQYTETSDAVTLAVSKKPKPQLTSSLKGDVLRGNSVTLSCTLTPQSAGWKFYWYKYTGRDWTETKYTETDSYTIRSAILSDGGQYICTARRGNPVYYTDYSDELPLTVIESPKPTVTINPDTQASIGETLTSDSQMSEMSDPVTLSVSEKPKPELTSSLKGDVLTGNSVTLSCTLTPQSAGLKFYWSKPTQSSETETETETETHQYIISSVSDGGQYRCRAGRGNPVYYTDYSDVLWVNVTESPKPTVTINPDTQVFIGETVTFRCDVEEGRDTEWTYEWFRDSNTFYPYSTSKEFSIRDVTNGQYTCRGTRTSDSQISEMSDSVTLSVSEKPKPTVIVTPQSSVYTGDNVTLSCNLMSTGWTFFWYKDQKSNPCEGLDTNTTTVTVSNEGPVSYYCKARRGSYDSAMSKPATITVSARPKPEVKVQPADHGIVFTGETVTFLCDLKTGGSWVYHWFRDNNELRNVKGMKIYKITDVKESHKGVYTCKGTQTSDPQYTETSDAVTLTVSEKPKPQLTSSLKGAVLRGNSVTLSCTLTSQSAGWKFYWYKYTGRDWTETETHQNIISPVRVSDGGQYWCRAGRGNPVYYTDYSDVLWVNVIESPKPTVTINPDTQVFIGETVTFKCDVEEGRDNQWTYNLFRDSNPLYPYRRTKEFSIRFVTVSHRGQYTCRGRRTSDSQMSKMSDPVTLSVSEKPKPELTSSLKGDVLRGNSVTLSCTLTPQSAGWKFYWSKPTQSSETETETHQYFIRSVILSDGGQYRCRARRGNPVFYTDYSDELSLTVIESPKPTVTINPDTQVFIEEIVTFRCDVQKGRDTEWTYDWFKDSYRFYPYSTTKEFSTSYVMNGQYTCRGTRTSDSQMSEMSDSVTLSVSGKPKPTVIVTRQRSIYTGDTVTLSCDLMSTGWTFLWYKDQKLNYIRDSDTNTHTVKVSNEGQVNYYCKARRGKYYDYYYQQYYDYNTEMSEPATITVRARPKPEVKVQPADHGFVFTGETVTFSCVIKTGGSWVYHWFRDNNELRDVNGMKNYIISDVKESHKGVYTCKGTQTSNPQYTETSDAVTLTVSEKPKPELTSSLKGDVLRGNSVTLSCTLTPQSAGWKFYWTTQGHWIETETASNSYTISSDKVYDIIKYKCRAGRGNPVYHTDYSNELSLTVIESPKPTVTINPDTQVFIGETVTFRCDVEEERDTEWTYDWFRDSNTFYPNPTTKEFSISDVTDSHRGQYTCRGRRTSDSQMSEMSDSVTLSVSGKPKPTVIVTPQRSVYTGDTVTLSCNLVSTGWTFFWYESQKSEGSYTNTLTVRVSNEGQVHYDCYASRGNYDSEWSEPATITVRARPKPEVKVQPADHGIVFTGETVTFSCEIKAGGSWEYQWFRDYNELNYAKGKKTYTIIYVKESHKGVYTCKGTQSSDPQYTETSDAVTLTVSEKPKPELTSNLKGDVLTGNSVTLYCTLTPQSAGWKFYWSKYTQSSETETETHQYFISSVRVSDGGQYRCRAGRENRVFYTDYSDELSLTVIESPKPTVIINPDTQVFLGEAVTFICDAEEGRDTEWTYGWFKDSITLYQYYKTKGFSTRSVRVSDRGQYTCRGRRSDSQMSEMSDPVTLSVSEKPKPQLTSSPKGDVLRGNSVTLYCTLTPQSAGWKFYWYKYKGRVWTETKYTETDSYTISSDKVYDRIQYRCGAGRRNTDYYTDYYTDYSDELSLTVNESPKPTVTINPDTQVFIGETVTFRCDVEEGRDTEWTYGWFRDSITLYQYSTKKEFIISSVTDSHRGQYTCRGRRTSDSQMSKMSDPVTLSVSGKAKSSVIVTPQSSVYTGDTVTLSCNLMSTGWKLLWYKGPTWNSQYIGASDTKTHTVRVSNEGQVNYYCKAHRGNYNSEMSEPATITVRARPKPEVKVQPADHGFVFTGETVTFSCEIKTGGSWVYHWFRDNKELSNAKGKNIYIITDVKESHKGVYTCKGTQTSDPQYTETSDAVTLTVSEKPKPELTSDLKGAALTGNAVILSCTLTPQSAGWKFYWIKPTQSSETETETHQYIISSVSVSDGGQYRCRAGRGNPVYYTDYSDVLWVNVTESPKPTVTINPDTQVFIGETVTFRCDVEEGRDTEWTYGWFRDSNTLYQYSTKKFTISYVTVSHRGQYTCRGRRTSDSQMSEMSDSVTLSVSEKPKPELTSSLKGDVLRGNSVTMSCTLTPQSAGWKFYWSKYTGRDWTDTKYTETNSYTISTDYVYYRIQYRCGARRGNRVYYTDYSNELSLTVIESPKPTVTINPDTQVFIGETVTFRCDVEEERDTEWTYNLFRDSNTLYQYSTIKEFSTSYFTDSHRGQYTCRGKRTSDSQMSKKSDPVTLSVSGKPKPTVIVTPQSSVYTGDTVTLSCNLMSTGWKFLWYKDQKQNPLSPKGSHTNTLTVRVSNEGQVNYYCKAHRGKYNYNTEMSEPATITVRARPKPEVKVQPDDHGFVFTGETVTFSCEIKTGGSWEYHWFRDNNELIDAKGKKIYTISDVKESHKGVYTCKGTQTSDPQYTETSDAVTLTVSEKPKPQLTSNLKGDVLTGNSVTLSCTLTPQSAGWKFYWSKPTQSSETETETHQYIIRSVILSDGGQYRCRAGRGNPVFYTDYSDELSLTVIESPKPTVTINPHTQVFIGEAVTFRCDVQKGRDTEWTYDWFKDSYRFYPYSTTKEFSTSYVMNGQYTCRGRRTSDSQMSEMSDSVTLSVSGKPKPTVIVTRQRSIYTGDTVTLRCNLVSTGWTFLWYKDQKLNYIRDSDTNTHTVKVSNEGKVNYYCKAHRGNYYYRQYYVYNTEMSEPATITVRARPKPEVKVQPDDHGIVFTGETVTFSCVINTGGSWVYHWFRDNNELSDAKGKKIYIISDVKESHKGFYTCKGSQTSDPQYTETSDAVKLTVSEKPKPQLTSSLKGDVLRGNSVTLYCTLTPQSAGWKFYWSKPTQSSETETERHQYIIRSVRVSDGGQYRCRAGRGNPVYYTDYSNELSLTVIESPKPTVTINPDTQVFIGETVTFRCDVEEGRDTEWTYGWFRDSNTFYPNPTKKEFSIRSVTVSHRGQYTCRGRRTSDSQMSEMSDPVTLSVSEKPKPQLTSNHKGDVLTGNSVTLYCTLTPQSAGWKFYWYKYTGRVWTETKYNETDSYTISSVILSDGGHYKCRAGRGNPVYYTVYSDVLWVNVIESPKAVVTIKPDKHVFRGETVTLRCEIQGGGDTEWIYSWYKDDQIYQDHKPQEFSLSSVVNEHSGKYTCRGRRRSDYQNSEISDAVTLTVSDVAETVMTVSPLTWLTEGDSVTLSCEVKHSSTGWTFSWYKDVLYTESQGSLRSRTSLLSDSSRGSGGSYTLSPVTLNHTGVYMCRAKRGVFQTQYSKTQPLWITGESSPVSLIIRPNRTQHFFADSLSLSCEDQSDTTGWTVRRYSYTEAFVDCSSVSGSTCNITFLYKSHTGVYWCQSKSGGCSNSVNITVRYGDVILDSPVHPVTEGHDLTLRCLFHNKKIPGSGVDFYKDDSILHSQTTGEMTISSVSKSDEGFYHCKHQERGESLKSWVSVRLQNPGPNIVPVAVAVGLTLTLLFIILLLILLWKHKSNKGKDRGIQQNSNQTPVLSPSGAENSQSGNSPLQTEGDNIYATVDNADHDAGPSDVTYAELELKTQKKAKKKQVKAKVEPDTLYSELKQDT
ncbi:titin-like [Tachysurus fulvidraco]|uniref:titin-like n=1 Tax=Tachysurus fulvidraco TaxID=1234273 RepID=UPI001FED8832|nr:titin-like [Tachysurus fulvidraco]